MGLSGSRPCSEAPTWKDSPDTKANMDEFKGDTFTIDGTGTRQIFFSKTGVASKEVLPAKRGHEYFAQAVANHGDKVALRVERPLPEKDKNLLPHEWTTWTWKQYYEEVLAGCRSVLKTGFNRYDGIAIYGFNAPEWNMSEMIAILAGGRVAGIYPSDPADQIAYKVKHSSASFFMIDGAKKVAMMQSFIDDLPRLHTIVVWGDEKLGAKELSRTDGSKITVVTWADFIANGKDEPTTAYDERVATIKAEECCALIYTSGTTGNPKGVMLSHDNVFWTACVVTEQMPITVGAERIISYLPLSHVAGAMVDIIAPLVLTAKYKQTWVEVYYARNYDLKLGTLRNRLVAVKPTLFLGVPRVWEKISEAMKLAASSITGVKKTMATWAKSKGLENARNQQMGATGAKPSNYGMAESLVLSKAKLALGLECCKFGFTGAAPVSTDTLEYFGQLGIQVNECYGMSESTGATTFSTDSAHVWGSCGWALQGMEVKCFIVDPSELNKKTECPLAADLFKPTEQEQGEICFRGRHIMMGYLANPDLGEAHMADIKKKCAETIDNEGWLHSGDKGCLDKRGLVRITGRYKELIIGSGGENVAPIPIEEACKVAAPAIANIMMVGDKRKFNVALVTIKAKGANLDQPGTDDLIAESLAVNPDCKLVSQAMQDEKFIKYLTDAITQVNKDLTPPCRIQRFTIMPRDFSVETEEFTPTFKLKRAFTEKKYAKAVENLFNEEAPATQCYFEFPGA